MKILIITLTFAGALTSTAATDELDAPATKPVTVRSELLRGLDAARGLSVTEPFRYGEQIDAIESANKQRNTDTDGFLLGLYYRAWHDMWLVASLGLRKRLDNEMAQAHARSYYLLFKGRRSNMQLGAKLDELLQIYAEPDEETRFPEIVKTKQFRGTYRTVDEKLKTLDGDLHRAPR